jgi:hypothetical protein
MQILVPAFFTADRKELARYSEHVRGWGSHDMVEIGLPLRLSGGALAERSTYFTVPLDYFFAAENRDAARQQRLALAEQVLAAPEGSRFALYLQLTGRRLLQERDRLQWSLMLILWALEEAPEVYFREGQYFGQAFAAYLQMVDELEAVGGQVAVFNQHLLSLDRVWSLREEREFAILARLDPKLEYLVNGPKEILNAYAKAWMLAFGMLTGVTEVLVLDLILEGFIAYLNFLSDMDSMDTEHELSSDEEAGAWLSFAGVFLPFVRILPEKIGNLVNAAMLLTVLTLFIKAVIQGLTTLLESLPRVLAAVKAGVETYAEVPVVIAAPDDPLKDQPEALFIPLG